MTFVLDALVSHYKRPLKIRDFDRGIKILRAVNAKKIKSKLLFTKMNKKDLSAINSHCILVFAHCFIGFLGSTAPDNLTAVMQLGLKIQ